MVPRQERASLLGVHPRFAWVVKMVAEGEIVLDLDEQVGKADRACARRQPAAHGGEVLCSLRLQLFSLVGLEAPARLVESDLAVVGDAFEKAIEGLCQAGSELPHRPPGLGGKTGSFPEVLPHLFPL